MKQADHSALDDVRGQHAVTCECHLEIRTCPFHREIDRCSGKGDSCSQDTGPIHNSHVWVKAESTFHRTT